MTSMTTTLYDAATVYDPAAPPLFSPSTTSVFPSLGNLYRWTFPTIPVVDTAFDIITIALIICFVFLSLLSVYLILYLRIKSRLFFKLEGFTTHWAPRFLLVVLITLWSINELFRLPVFKKRYIFPFLRSLEHSHQAQFCKNHVILSFGLFEPGFLVVLLFLVDISIKKRSRGNFCAMAFVAIMCLVIALYLAVYVLPGLLNLPPIFYRSAVLLVDGNTGARIVYCTYPLLGTVVFAAFSMVYALVFLATCGKVMALVINKRLKARGNILVWTVLGCLATQVFSVTISAFWNPNELVYYIFVLVSFTSIITCGVVVEGIMVIMQTRDSLKVASVPIEERREYDLYDDEDV